jgi:Protein of unknown function (DUF642)/PEP-CTERM motif
MRKLIALGIAALASTSAQATINLVTNGSFEEGIPTVGSTFVAGGDSTSIVGWTTAPGGVDYVDDTIGAGGWVAADGSRTVELATGHARSGIQQDIEGFEIGKQYQVSFKVSANPYNPEAYDRAPRLRYSYTATPGSIAFDFSDGDLTTPLNMLYQTVMTTFTATTSMQRISFRGAYPGNYGVVIDDVSVSAIPEPASWAMMIAGFAMVGIASRRRSRGAIAA